MDKIKVEDLNHPEKGYVINSLIAMKPEDSRIFGDGGGMAIAYLDGYAIIPLEEYEELKASQKD